MSVTVGTLIIDLKANTASFSGEMGKMAELSAKTANDVKRSLEKITLAGAAMASALVVGTAGVVRSALDQVDALGKAAQAAGTSAETLSTLQYAAKLSNVENEQLVKGLEKLSLAAFKAQGGNIQLENIFKRLGVSIMDANGHLKDSGVLLEDMAPKFSAMADGAGKTALAQSIFGKAGAGLIPMLNQYGEEQARINDEAHRFGLVMSQSTVDVAMKAHDNLDRLTSVLKGMGFSLLSATLPALDELLQKLINISQNADMQGLAKAFGEKVSSAVRTLGDALDFAVKHAQGLKVALEALAAIKISSIIIPLLADLSSGGGLATVGKGIDKFTLSFLGLERVLPSLKKLSAGITVGAESAGALAAGEGAAVASTGALGAAFTALGGPIGIATAAVIGLTAAIYHFRDATFEVKGQTYELRDIWSGAWIEMKDAMAPVGRAFNDLMDMIKKLWSDMVNFISQNALAKRIVDDVKGAGDWLKAHLPSLVNDGDIDALNRARAARLAANQPATATPAAEARKPAKPAPDTSGLGKAQKDPYADEIAKINEAIEAQKAYLAVIDGTPEAIQAATAAEKANAAIVQINNRLHDEGRALLTSYQESVIRQKVATEESLKALVDYGRELVSQQHSADLSIQQTRAMALAQMQGDEAVRQATIDNAILAVTYNKTAEQLARMAPELQKLRDLLSLKSNVDLVEGVDREVFAINQEIASQRILQDAMGGTIAAQRQAEIEAKTYAINQQIAATADDTARAALIQKRDAMVEQMRIQQQASDLQEASRALATPGDQFDDEMEHLQNMVRALEQAQGGMLTYAQEVQVASAQQDIFDKAIDQTVQSMIRFGGARDGVDAFFLDMQKEAQSTASIVYEALHSAFDKISDQLATLVTGGKTSFAKMFQDIGKQIVQAEIKKQMQDALKNLGQHFPSIQAILGEKETAKLDGQSSNTALWVQFTSANAGTGSRSGNELTDLIGPNPPQTAQQAVQQVNQIAQHPPIDLGSALSDLPSFVKLLGGLGGQKSPFGESLGLPTGGNELTDLLGQTGIGGPKGTANNPLYVKTSGGSLGGQGMGGLGGLLGGSGSGGDDLDSADAYASDSMGGGFFSGLLSKFTGLLGGLGGLSGGSSGGMSSLLAMLGGLIPHAEGGPVTPSSAYLVGEKGPEILTGVSGQITSNANSMRALSSSAGDTHYYSIDARGTDPVLTDMRVRRAILESHQSAVTTSIQGNAERLKRVPQRY